MENLQARPGGVDAILYYQYVKYVVEHSTLSSQLRTKLNVFIIRAMLSGSGVNPIYSTA